MVCNICQTYLSKTLCHSNSEFRGTHPENAGGGKSKKDRDHAQRIATDMPRCNKK